MWCFRGEGVWIWCSDDNHISGWGIFLRSGSKINKKIIFSHISCCQVTFQQQAVYENDFLKSSLIWMHISRSTTYYLLPWPPHWICKMANHDMCDGKCYPSWVYVFTVFLANIPHLNYQQNITDCLETIVNIREWHAPGHHDLHIRFSKWPLDMAHPSNWNYLRYNRDFLYISVSKCEYTVMCPWPLNSYARDLWRKYINYIRILV